MRKKNYKYPARKSGGWREGKDRVWGKKMKGENNGYNRDVEKDWE